MLLRGQSLYLVHFPKCNPTFWDITQNVEENDKLYEIFRILQFIVFTTTLQIDHLWDSAVIWVRVFTLLKFLFNGGLIFYWIHSLSTYKFRQGILTIAGQCNIYKKQCTIFYITYSRRYLLAYLWLINGFFFFFLIVFRFILVLGSKRFGCDYYRSKKSYSIVMWWAASIVFFQLRRSKELYKVHFMTRMLYQLREAIYL